MGMLNHAENYVWSNISGSVTGFILRGGAYGVTVKATWGGGSVTVQKLAADGSTYVTCLTAFTADGYASVNLPQGVYKVLVTTATGVYLDISAIVTVGE